MAEERMRLPETLRKGEEPGEDPLREIVRWAVQELMEAEVAAQIGAGRYERTDERSTQRNGYRPRPWDTRVGTLELQIPKLRQGSYLPGWLEPRRRAEQALVAVVAEAYVQGVSTRKVEALVQALGHRGDLQERSEPAGGVAGRAGGRVPHPAAGCRRTRTSGWMRATSMCGRTAAWSRWR